MVIGTLDRLKAAAHQLHKTEREDDLRAHEEAEADLWSAAIAYSKDPEGEAAPGVPDLKMKTDLEGRPLAAPMPSEAVPVCCATCAAFHEREQERRKSAWVPPVEMAPKPAPPGYRWDGWKFRCGMCKAAESEDHDLECGWVDAIKARALATDGPSKACATCSGDLHGNQVYCSDECCIAAEEDTDRSMLCAAKVGLRALATAFEKATETDTKGVTR